MFDADDRQASADGSPASTQAQRRQALSNPFHDPFGLNQMLVDDDDEDSDEEDGGSASGASQRTQSIISTVGTGRAPPRQAAPAASARPAPAAQAVPARPVQQGAPVPQRPAPAAPRTYVQRPLQLPVASGMGMGIPMRQSVASMIGMSAPRAPVPRLVAMPVAPVPQRAARQ